MLNNMEYLNDACFCFEDDVKSVKQNLITKDNGMTYIPKMELLNSPIKKLLLFEILNNKGFSNTVIDNVTKAISGRTGKQFFSDTHRLLIDRNHLILTTKEEKNNNIYLVNNSDTFITDPINLKITKFNRTSQYAISKERNKACFDADIIEFPLTIRHPKQGDCFKPLGSNGFKKLSDFFIDEKISIINKEKTWLLVSNNQIIWIIGKRIDDRFKVRDTTKNIIEASVNPS
jgi:tRNA(Ile)-lysidine synthase